MILAEFVHKHTGEIYESFFVSEKGIYTFNDLNLEYGKTIETQGTTGNKPVSYVTALALAKGSIKIHLDQRFVDVQGKIGRWKNIAETRDLFYFKIGGKLAIPNPVVIESTKVSNIRINGRGIWLSADIDVSFQEYAGGQEHDTIGILQKRLEDYS